MDNIKLKEVELLAPAGSMEAFIAAVENGADAVYIGGKLFNARINATNFHVKEIKSAVAYAHVRNVKVYVTLNILLMDEELNDALKYAEQLYNVGVDALIVQDLGIAKLVKEQIPGLSLHLSTQGSVYNLSGVKSAKALGFERVVLARELSIQEIEEITKAKVCEIEVFVHGALCVCYSGQCQMSRAIGKRSGNRGQCAQPCRLPYQNEKGEKGYFLSPKDLCTIDDLGKIVEAGVKSLKIEGRMKSPEYVAIVVSIYRKYLDLYLRHGQYIVSDEDRKKLLQIFNRGDFTTGYFFHEDDFFSGRLPKHQGIYIGKTVGRKDQNLIVGKLVESLDLGDGIEIGNKDLSGNVVTYLKEVAKGQMEIGDIKGAIKGGEDIYKITSKALKEEARKSFSGKPKKKIPIKMVFEGKVESLPILTISEGIYNIKVQGKVLCERAIKRPTEKSLIERQLKKTGDTPFFSEKISIKIEDNLAISASEINSLRRKAIEKLIAAKTKLPQAVKVDDVEKLPLNPMKVSETDLQKFPNITKGEMDEYIHKNLRHMKKGVIVENLGWIQELVAGGVKVYGGAGLNVCNEKAQKALEKLGVNVIEVSPELRKESSRLMTIERNISAKTLEDRAGRKYKVISEEAKTVIKKE